MTRRIRAAITLLAILASAGLALGTAVPASALTLPLPQCSLTDPGVAPNLAGATNQGGLPSHCWYLPQGGTVTDDTPGGSAAGYLGADDNHTRYRFIQTTFPVTPQLINLNGTGLNGAVGTEECDPNIAFAAQFGVLDQGGVFTPYYAEGHWTGTMGDPCINHEPLVPDPNPVACPVGGNANPVTNTFTPGPAPNNLFCGSFAPVAVNDVLADFAIYYTPGLTHHHQVSFGFCDVTGGYCRQAYAHQPVTLNFWEVGVGVFSANQHLGAPPGILLVSFTNTGMNCYSCSPGPRPFSVIQPVNSTGVGGIEQVQDVNSSNQAVLSPDSSLVPGTGNWSMYNGSTS